MNTRRLIDTRWSAITLILVITLLRIVYLLRFCPYELVEDEAYYWLWSKRLAFSYYSKGPGIAWLIAASTRLLGDTEAAVRIPAAIATALAAWSTSAMAWRISRDHRVAFASALAFMLAPMLQGVALLGTIDAPFLACWAAAALLCQKAVTDDRPSSWWLLAVVVAVGTWFKHTMLLAILAILISVALSRRARSRIAANALLATITFAALVAPMFLADRTAGWPAIHHLIGHLRLSGGDTPVAPSHYDPLWTLAFLVMPLAIVGPLVVPGAVEMLRRTSKDEETVLKVFCAVPLLFYFIVSFLAKPQGNWTLPAFITLLPFAGRAAIAAFDPHAPSGWPVHVRRLAIAAVVVGMISGVGMLRLDLVAKIPRAGRLVPMERIFGAKRLASAVARELRASGDPIVITSHYGVASRLLFYLPQHPAVFCASRFLGGRPSQFDVWPDTDLRNAHRLQGRSAVLIAPADVDWIPAFDRLERVPRPLPGGRYELRIGRGFRGWVETLP